MYILGTTGEGMSLSVEERMKVAEAWKSFGKMETIMNHIGANSIADVKALAAHSEKIGLDAIALLAPFYYKCNDLDSLMDYLKEVHINRQVNSSSFDTSLKSLGLFCCPEHAFGLLSLRRQNWCEFRRHPTN